MKKFNKLLTKPKRSEDEPSADDVRAQYYASRASSNPFADAPAANPFDDSDEEDDPLAGFAKKKPDISSRSIGEPASLSKGGSNPFDDEVQSSSVTGRSIGQARDAKTNPFEEDRVATPLADDRGTNPFGDEKQNNPFEDEEQTSSVSKPNKGGNPFGEPTPSPSRDVNNNPFDSPQKDNTSKKIIPPNESNPFDSSPAKPQMKKPLAVERSKTDNAATPRSSPRNNNRMGRTPMQSAPKADVTPSKPPMVQRSISHNQVDNLRSLTAMTPNATTTTGATHAIQSTASTDKRKLWRGFGNNTENESSRPILSAIDDESLTQQQLLLKGSTANAAGLASWLRLNKKEDEDMNHRQPPHTKSNIISPSKKKTRKKCKAVITAWPFDNFHEVQEQQLLYEELASRAASDYNTINEEGYPSTNYENDRIPQISASETKYYERPEELISIKEAVINLPLVDFEKKAEERAINIVSTWLFDAGLIDELLVNGGVVQHPTVVPDDRTIKSQEGVEIGTHGFPLLGAEGAEQKIDKETNKLRGMIQRDLSIINARLNDGVAASGLEVQELVNAVAVTKKDIGRLRELTTYISDSQISGKDEFLLANYPHLRRAINARRNINRCFRELEFFSQIPSTCDRLRDELHGGEWTEEEWSTIRNVAMEHVELEIMLVEAENGMKAGQNLNNAVVDNFLESHVQNVWELGDEIRMRMLSGIGSAFDLAINNPAGMVALVEAVEVYEKAAESFEKNRQDSAMKNFGKLRFTNMRAAALEQLYQDFELRGVEMFRNIHEQAADIAEEEDASNTQFTAVLKAATELVTEIDIVKHQMSPCFAPHWHVEALWSSCVAHVCSNHIVQQIGGADGQNLPELTITQLLELVAWVEYFRETIEETFPEVAEMHDTKKSYFEERPDLFEADKRTVNMRNATDSLAWVNNMLWEVHRLAQEEFLVRTRSQTDEWLDKVYESETVKNQSSEGKLTTSLCEDVFSFSSVQLRTIRERLSKKSDALILAVCVILSHMRSKQVHSRNNFLQDLETCCAASNDFTRMCEKCEDVCTDLISQCEFSEDMIATIEASSNELMVVYSSDAVYAARSVHIYVFDPIEEEIGTRLFEQAWEEDMVGNDLALSLIRTLEDFYDDLVHFMDDFMVVKSVMSLMSASVIFYVKCLLTRAERHRSNKKPYFGDVSTALNRMTGDIKVMREYFEGLVPKMPALKKNIEKDFEIISTVHELMSIAAGLSISEAEDFILVLQKRVRDVGITKHIVGDLWHLVAPTDERYVWELVESMEEQLQAIAPPDDALALEVNDRSYVKGLRLDEMAVKLYVKSKRVRPVKSTVTENIIHNWRTTWAVRAEEGMEDNRDLY